MATKKKMGIPQVKSKPAKISAKPKGSGTKLKAPKVPSKISTTTRGKPKASKKTTNKPKSSVSSVKKTKTVTSQKKRKPPSSLSRKPPARSAAAKRLKGSDKKSFSSQDCYHIGGLCACVIDTTLKEGQGRLQRLLKHLDLSEIDQANLMRVSQGVRIPKLFADGWAEGEIRRRVLDTLKDYAKADDPSGKQWKADLQEIERLLGD